MRNKNHKPVTCSYVCKKCGMVRDVLVIDSEYGAKYHKQDRICEKLVGEDKVGCGYELKGNEKYVSGNKNNVIEFPKEGDKL